MNATGWFQRTVDTFVEGRRCGQNDEGISHMRASRLEDDMRGNQLAHVPNSHVLALFTDTAIAFSFMDGATFAALADNVAKLCERYADLPTAIYLRVNGANQPVAMLHSGI